MQRKKLQDVIPSKQRSETKRQPVVEPTPVIIKKVAPVKEPLSIKRDTIVAPMRPEREVYPYLTKMRPEYEPPKKRSYKGFIIWTVTIISVIVLAFALSLIYASATVKVTPKVASLTVDSTLTAKKDASSNELQYELMTITKEGSDTVASTPGKKIQTKAKGSVTLYNSNSTAQKLSAGVILTNANGLRYKIANTVTVPAAKKVSGKVTPGSVTVTVNADQIGAEYNMKLTDLKGDFQIDMFKNTSKYTTIIGHLKTNITGGEDTVTQVIDPKLASTTRQKIDQTLQDQLLASAQAQTPDGYILFDNAHVINYQTLANTLPATSDKPSTNLNERATFYGIIFKKDALLTFIAKNELSKFNNGSVNSDSLQDLDFSIVNTSTFKPQSGSSLVFNLKGLLKLIGEYPENQLKTALAGKHVKDISTVLSQYGTIASADVIIRPFWKQTFPNDPNKITIEAK